MAAAAAAARAAAAAAGAARAAALQGACSMSLTQTCSHEKKKHCLQQARPPSLHAAARSSQLPDARSLHPLVIAPAAAPDFPATPVLCSLAWPLINAGSALSSCSCSPLRFPLSADHLVPYQPLTSPYRSVAHQAGKHLPSMLTSTPMLSFSQQTLPTCMPVLAWLLTLFEMQRVRSRRLGAPVGVDWKPSAALKLAGVLQFRLRVLRGQP